MSAGETLTLSSFARGREIEVNVARIDAELDRLWRAIARRQERRDGRIAPVHRACLMNLVVHAGDERAEVVARYLVAVLSDRLPARVILIRAEPDGVNEGPRAWISSIADPATDHRDARVAGELVVLHASGTMVDRLPALVLSALEPDMPTTLWWAGPLPTPEPYVEELCDTADRIVVDSDAFVGGNEVAHVLRCSDAARLADLAWPRQRPWRSAIARAFDDPANRTFLEGLEEVEIGVGSTAERGRERASGGPLLAGWLAAALGWRTCVREDGGAVCFPAAAGDERQLAVRILPRASRNAGVVDVTLRGTGGALRFERRERPARVAVDVPAGFERVRSAELRERPPEDVLADAVLAVRADPIAPESIRRAAEISAALGA